MFLRCTALPSVAVLVALAPLVALAATACGGAKEPDAPSAKASGPRPSCEAIDHACDPYEDTPGLGKDCHDLGESRSSTEEQCAAKKDACLAACPPKK